MWTRGGSVVGDGGGHPGARRPPSTTDPGAALWRDAVRSGSLACLAPTRSVTSACIISFITRSPTATLIANSPSRASSATSANANCRSADNAGNTVVVSSSSTTRKVDTVFFTVVVPCLVGVLGGTRHLPAGRSQAGDRHLTSTSLGTTSDDR